MSISSEKKTQLITDYRRNEKDTGSPEIQVAVLTDKIVNLTEHLKANKHDYSSRRGLLKMVSTRNRLLRYLSSNDRPGYQKLIGRLGLRK